MKIVLNIFIFNIITLLFISCSSADIIPINTDIKFIVINNTFPVSPFKIEVIRLPQLVKSIKKENPIFVMHTGNIIYGGNEWMGINKTDIDQQYYNFFSLFSEKNIILYTIAGKKDLYNNSAEIYNKVTKKNLFYSFNYGSIHFIILNTLKNNGSISDKKQLKWLKKDLEFHKNYPSIFIFTHEPILKKKDRIKNSNNSIHNLLKQYPVKAVISGNIGRLNRFKKDKIQYISAGCTGFNSKFKSYYSHQYYIFSFIKNKLLISAKKLN